MQSTRNINSTANAPLVSVIIPAYNAERCIKRAITSVMAQTVEDWEIIVTDDCSSDRTYDIIKAISEEESRVRAFRNEKNIGAAKTRNLSIDRCRGKYIALLDCDDVWYPEKLSRQLELMADLDADIVYCSYSLVDGASGLKRSVYCVPPEIDFDGLLKRNVISCSTAIMRRQVFDTHRFNPDFYHEDYVLWLDLLRSGYKAWGCVEVLADYTIGRKSRSSNKIRNAAHRWVIYRRYLKFPFFKSVGLMTAYAFTGIKKYGKREADTDCTG